MTFAGILFPKLTSSPYPTYEMYPLPLLFPATVIVPSTVTLSIRTSPSVTVAICLPDVPVPRSIVRFLITEPSLSAQKSEVE